MNLSSLAHRSISDMIADRRLKGGEAIIEARLADLLGISRTPLREALQRLEGEGLVRKVANRSYVVRQVDVGEYLHSLRVREILEGEAAALAAGAIPGEKLAATRHEIKALRRSTAYHTKAHWQSDDNLHGLYIDHCGNPVMAEMIRALRITTRLFEIAKLKDRLEPDSAEHLAILEALEASDKRAARTTVQQHCRSLRDSRWRRCADPEQRRRVRGGHAPDLAFLEAGGFQQQQELQERLHGRSQEIDSGVARDDGAVAGGADLRLDIMNRPGRSAVLLLVDMGQADLRGVGQHEERELAVAAETDDLRDGRRIVSPAMGPQPRDALPLRFLGERYGLMAVHMAAIEDDVALRAKRHDGGDRLRHLARGSTEKVVSR